LFVERGDDEEIVVGGAEGGDERVKEGGADAVVVGNQEAHRPSEGAAPPRGKRRGGAGARDETCKRGLAGACGDAQPAGVLFIRPTATRFR
jgi:hypothetical protein